MINKGLLFLSMFGVAYLHFSCAGPRKIADRDFSPQNPRAEREFRAAWVATVANINWPSKPGIPVEEQKQEAIRLLDLLHKTNFNAVIFQVRPQCDALYESKLEPWSYYLTGEQGKAPQPFYDPLKFWIDEAHKRGLELHAWLNPYRAHHRVGGEVTEFSIVKRRPDLAVPLETGYWWLDPSKKGTQDHSYNVVMDIVRRYDVDGIHFDDYFYPYPSYNNNQDFPDGESWQEYLKGGGKLSRGDWRRKGVNDFIQRLYKGIKKEKPSVKFGLSPFGIWRPQNPPSISGFDQHHELYADARLWLNEGWMDYWTPQLYWPINQIPQSYPVLLGWWSGENNRGRHLWPGMSIGRLAGEKAIDETINQIMVTRGMLPESPGNAHWSIGPLIAHPELAIALLEGPYQKPALIPPSPWLDKAAPKLPSVQAALRTDQVEISWSHDDYGDVGRWVIYSRYGSTWNYQILGPNSRSQMIPAYVANRNFLENTNLEEITDVQQVLIPVTQVAVSAVDRAGNESDLVRVVVSGISYQNAPSLQEILDPYREKPRRWGIPWMMEWKY